MAYGCDAGRLVKARGVVVVMTTVDRTRALDVVGAGRGGRGCQDRVECAVSCSGLVVVRAPQFSSENAPKSVLKTAVVTIESW